MATGADNYGILRLFDGIRWPNDQYEQIHSANPGKNQPCAGIGQALWRAKAEQCAQQYPQIEPGKMNDVALLYILDPPQKTAAYTAPVKAKGKTALHFLAPRTQKRLALAGFQPGTVPVHRCPRFYIAIPAQMSLCFRLTDPAAATIRQTFQDLPAMIALIRHQVKGLVNTGRFFLLPDRTQLGLSICKRVRNMLCGGAIFLRIASLRSGE